MTTKDIQCALHILGLPDGGLDGIPGVNTATGIRRFQKAAGLPVTGEADDDTVAAMREAIYFGMPAETHTQQGDGDFWDEIEYFVREEFRCPCGRCGGFPTEPHENMVRGTDAIRRWAGVPITPASGVRCQEHNDELPGSVPNSWHVRGQAVDIAVKGKTPQQVEAYAKTLPHYYSSYIMTSGGVHIQFSD